MNIAKKAYCRLCAVQKQHSKLLDLDSNEEKWAEITDKLNRINANTSFTTQYLPKTVCFVCIHSLERAHEFVTAVDKAQATLHQILLVQEKQENVDSESETCFEAAIKYEYESIEVKVEAENPESTNSLMPLSGESSNSQKGKTRGPSNLDSIPLAQLKLTWEDYNWLCSICETQFPTINELTEHSMKYHNCCNPYRCTDCNIRKLRLDRFLIHVQRHKKHLRLSCYKCLQKFSNTKLTLRHMKTHNKTAFICLGCNTQFSNVDELTKHTTEFYMKQRVKPVPIKCDGLTCPKCNKTFTTKSGIYSHLFTHTERSRDYICNICGKSFLHKKSLADHIILHNDARPYKCKICNFAFKTEIYLRNHIGVHNGVKPFSCDQCGRCFRLQGQLVSHRIIHTDLLPYVCSYCDKRFRFKSILNLHLRQHTGVKPYKCEVCNRDFTNWSNYNKHMKRKHNMDMAKKKQPKENESD